MLNIVIGIILGIIITLVVLGIFAYKYFIKKNLKELNLVDIFNDNLDFNFKDSDFEE